MRDTTIILIIIIITIILFLFLILLSKKEKYHKDTSYIFNNIYDNQLWSKEGNGSGTGSSLNYTRYLRQLLEEIILKYKITSLLDVACGGMLWMPLLLENIEKKIPNFRYMGMDIVESVLNNNKLKFKNRRNWNFEVVDASKVDIPKDYDIILCRDMLQHLSYDLILKVLKNFSNSGAKYLLVGSYLKNGHNENIETGLYFHIDLNLPPFNLKPLKIFSEKENPEELDNEPEKFLYLYSLPEISISIANLHLK